MALEDGNVEPALDIQVARDQMRTITGHSLTHRSPSIDAIGTRRTSWRGLGQPKMDSVAGLNPNKNRPADEVRLNKGVSLGHHKICFSRISIRFGAFTNWWRNWAVRGGNKSKPGRKNEHLKERTSGCEDGGGLP